MSLYFVITIDVIVVFGANRIRKSMLNVFRTVSVQVYGAIRSRGQSLLRKVNGNMDSAKYQSVIIHDIEMTSECDVFPQEEYIYLNNLTPCYNSNNTRTFQKVKEYLFWNGREFARHVSHRERLEYNEERDW